MAKESLRFVGGASFDYAFRHRRRALGEELERIRLREPRWIDEEKISECDARIENLSGTTTIKDQKALADAIIMKGILLSDRDEALQCFDKVTSRFIGSSHKSLRIKAFEAAHEKYYTYRFFRGDIESALSNLDEVSAFFADDPDPHLRWMSIQVLNFKGAQLRAVGRPEEALLAYAIEIKRLESETTPELAAELAKGLLEKAETYEELGDNNNAILLIKRILSDEFSHLLFLTDEHDRTVYRALSLLLQSDLDHEAFHHSFLRDVINRVAFSSLATFLQLPTDYIAKMAGRNIDVWIKDVLPSGKTIEDVILEAKDKYSYTDKVPDNTEIDILEQKLDRLKAEYESRFGRDAAREAFARRASAVGDGPPKAGIVGSRHSSLKDRLGSKLNLSDIDRAAFLEASTEHQWNESGDLSPSQFMQEHFGQWFDRGLTIDLIAEEQPSLMEAYKEEIRHYPRRRIKALTRPHRLPAGTPTRMRKDERRVAELSEAEHARRRERERKKKARYRDKHPKPT